MTPDLVYLLEEYKKGRQPQRITSTEPTFFDPRSGEPSVWYSKDKDGTVEIFDLMGFHPETREELQPITPEIVDVWKAQNKRREARPPQQVDPETFAFFDALTGKPRVWYWRGKNGEYEFYDNPGYHQRTGERLAIITPEAIAAWKDAIKQQQQKAAEFAAAQERARQAALEKQQRQAAELAAARERQQKAALEQQQRQAAELAAEQERERQAVASCDQMAANSSDVRKPGDVAGVPYNDLKTNAKAAADACTLAMRVNPEEIRYQYARALEIDDPKKALKIHEQLIHDGYLASYDNAGSILIGTYKNIPEAIKYFNEGVRRGDPDSMVSLASLIDQHYVFKNNPAEAKYALLTRAAELGHPGAKLAIERAREQFQELQQQREFQQQQQQLMLQLFGHIMQGIAH